jgi:TonB family protein
MLLENKIVWTDGADTAPSLVPSLRAATSVWLEPPSKTARALGFAFSPIVHVLVALSLTIMRPTPERRASIPVRVRISHVEKPKISVHEDAPVTPAPRPPRTKTRPKLAASEPKSKEKPVEPVKPIQGLPAKTLAPSGRGIAAPVGNTLMHPDDGPRERLDDVKSLGGQDASADAMLIASSVVVPKYTDEAIDANVEASVPVDVFVDTQGSVTDVELKKRVGFGMDERIIASAKHAKFLPRKDQYGRAVAGWTEIRFRLEIPN